MEIVVSEKPPQGFDASLTVPSGYARDDLVSDLRSVLDSIKEVNSGIQHIQVWIENAHEIDSELLDNLQLEPYRDLLQLRCGLPPQSEALPTRNFIKGVDEKAFLEVNRRAFAWHPEQGNLTAADLSDLFEEDWFDEDGFLLYDIGQQLAGFCWTKIHGNGRGAIGEIFAIAVDPDFHGQGIGKPLTVSGLNHLASKGITTGMLYVEADNAAAIHIYRQIGFSEFSRNRAFRMRIPN